MGGHAWMAQLVKHPTLDFGSGHDPRVLGSSSASGSQWSVSLLGIFSLSCSLCSSSAHSLPPRPPPTSKLKNKLKKKRTPSSLCAVSTEPDTGLEPMKYEIITWAEFKSWTLNQLSYPGIPMIYSYF